ncbi:MAG TPA: hypothetical protein VJO13_15785 [Ktedonobacterales bacterium]|nr:hypothetical protein [Ktedonobacterales bacterium]
MQRFHQQLSDGARVGHGGAALRPDALTPSSAREYADSWEKSWSRDAAPSASSAATAWWMATDEGYALLQRLALAHLIVGVCVAIALAWQVWSVSGPVQTPAIGLIVAAGGALAFLCSRQNRPTPLLLARLALVVVDMSAAGGILLLRGGEGWTLLVFLPAIALAIAFFAERGGALATVLAALIIVAMNSLGDGPLSGWMPSLLVFLGASALIVAFLGIYSAHITETSENLRWLLSDVRASNERLRETHQTLLMRLRAAEQAQEPLLRERARLGDAAAELAMLTQLLAQGDPAAIQTVQTLRPGAFGPLAELASALSRYARASGGSWRPSAVTAVTALEMPIRTQGQALSMLDTVARSLCVGANELVLEAEALEPGVSLIGSGQYSQTLWQLEQHLRAQAAHMALLGTQLAEIRSSQENLEAVVTRMAVGAKTPSPTSFDTSDVRAVSLYSGPQVTFGASAIRRAAIGHPNEDETVRWGNWQNPPSIAYNRGV